MPEEPVQVDPETIRTHATSIEALSGPLEQAAAAARAVSAPTDAFGKLCAFLPPLFVDSVEEGGIAALEAARTAVVEDARKLGAAADSFTGADDAVAAALLQAGGEVSK
ncbi:type VII secretion target [Nocardia sp. NBC_00416]|uniref:type VII secretion target n=1 Tax=Nocardia sp. NBC_00416 TaxID=2975991 RepID=UPI002E1FA443